MNSKLTKIGAIALSVTISAPAMAASSCPTPAETAAEHVRILQTELMVAALKCRARTDLNLYDKYNTFVRKYTPELVQHGKALTGYFERTYGAGYRQKLDKYITTLANSVSISSDKNAKFCDSLSAEADAVLAGTGSATLVKASIRNPSFAKLPSCGPSMASTVEAGRTPVAAAE